MKFLLFTAVLNIYFWKEITEASMQLPIVINTWPLPNATSQAYTVLQKENGTLLDAVVAGCTAAEEDRKMTSVGWGGSPAENGETALDALIIDGVTHNMGAVGSMKRIKNAIAVAKHVLENTKHTLLVGEDATAFAVLMGFKEESLSSNESRKQWEDWKTNNCQPNFWQNVSPDPKSSCGPYKPVADPLSPIDLSRLTTDESKEPRFDKNNHDTIGLIAIDGSGNIAGGTSTNGATFKITGRVGDSPIPGSGAYVDNDLGGAAATGDGDVMMRFSPSYQTVENMRHGMSPSAAAEDALRRILKYYPKFEGALVAVNKVGDYGAACYGWDFQYTVQTPLTGEPKVISVKPIIL